MYMKKTKAAPRSRPATRTTSSSALPSSLTRVTPFSKYLAMFLFVLLPFIGFYLGMKFQTKMLWMLGPGACLEMHETLKLDDKFNKRMR